MRVQARHLRTPEVYAEVNANLGIREVSDEAAVTIASWYAAPSGVGQHLAALSTGAEVRRADVLIDVSDTIAAHYSSAGRQDQRCLDMLGTWVLHQVETPRPCSVCGWQYPQDRLDQARRGEMRLDPMPTHRCTL